MAQTALSILTYVKGITGVEEEPNLPDGLTAEYIDICCMAYYAGRDKDRTGNWRPNSNNWTGTGDDSLANALAIAWACYAMGNRTYRNDQAKVTAAAAEKPNKRVVKVSDPDTYDGTSSKYDTSVMQVYPKFS